MLVEDLANNFDKRIPPTEKAIPTIIKRIKADDPILVRFGQQSTLIIASVKDDRSHFLL